MGSQINKSVNERSNHSITLITNNLQSRFNLLSFLITTKIISWQSCPFYKRKIVKRKSFVRILYFFRPLNNM